MMTVKSKQKELKQTDFTRRSIKDFVIDKKHYDYRELETEIEKVGFNNLVICATIRICGFMKDWETVGRLVQVRKSVGKFKTDLFFIRRFDGSLHSFENEAVFPVKSEFIDFYNSFFQTDYIDEENRTYYINNKKAKTGFIISRP